LDLKVDLRRKRNDIHTMQPPVFSLYVRDGSEHGSGRLALALKNAAREAGIGASVRLLYDLIETHEPVTRTVAMFTDGKRAMCLSFRCDLPGLETGREETLWRLGPAYVAPLDLALASREATLVVAVEQDRWWLFAGFLGAFSAIDTGQRPPAPGEDDELASYRGATPAFIPMRSSAVVDLAKRHHEGWVLKFAGDLADRCRAWVRALDVDGIMLVGPPDLTQAVARHLPAEVLARVKCHVPMVLSGAGESPEHTVRDLLREHEVQHDERALGPVESGLVCHGPARCFEALNDGRLETLVVPWSARQKVIFDPGQGLVASDARSAGERGLSGEPRVLVDILPDVVARRRVRPVFVRGVEEERLHRDYQGMAGTLRW
jgi:hypothetical protein